MDFGKKKVKVILIYADNDTCNNVVETFSYVNYFVFFLSYFYPIFIMLQNKYLIRGESKKFWGALKSKQFLSCSFVSSGEARNFERGGGKIDYEIPSKEFGIFQSLVNIYSFY